MWTALLLSTALDVTSGTYDAWLDAPIGKLPIRLEIARDDHGLTATIHNGAETLTMPVGRSSEREIVIEFPHYDAALRAQISNEGRTLDGEWTKRAGPDRTRRLPFHAVWTAGATPARPVDSPASRPTVAGRWRAQFAKDPEPSVAILRGSTSGADANAIEGTFLTATGDYRYLYGHGDRTITLAGFDGGHALLFTAEIQPDGSLAGRFSSGDSFTDTWTAVRDDAARLSDDLTHAHWDDAVGLATMQFPDFDGNLVSLADPRFDGRVRVLQLTGSWCPNCQDETAFLAELDREYRTKGVSFVALAFEVTGERERDTQMAKRMLARHGATYLGLLAGRNDKDASRQALPALDRIFAFPTTVFLNRDGRVRAVHTGFSGPATGDEYVALKARYRALLDELVAEKEQGSSIRQDEVVRELWRDERERTITTIERGPDGALKFSASEITRFDRPTRTEPVDAGEVRFVGSTVRMGRTTWHFDERAHVMLDANDVAHRLTPAARSPFPWVRGVGYSEMPQILEGLSSTDAVRRRESAYYLALQIVQDRLTPQEFGGGQLDPGLAVNLLPLLDDADAGVRATAAWGAGVTGLDKAVEKLTACTSHGFAPVRREAARALGYLGAASTASVRARLETMAAHDADPLVREAASRSLASSPPK